MEDINSKLYAVNAGMFYRAGLFLGVFSLALLMIGILSNAESWTAVLLLAACLYLGLGAITYSFLGWKIQGNIWLQHPAMGFWAAWSAPLVWSNGILAEEKAYREIQRHAPSLEAIKYCIQFPSAASGLVSLLPGLRPLRKWQMLRNFRQEPGPLRVKPQIQSYVWGRPALDSFIIRFLGLPLHASQQTVRMAELWFGAHKKNPGRVEAGNCSLDLDRFSQEAGEKLLGPGRKEIGQLFKVLDAVEPLSLQMHDRYKPDSKNECWMVVIDRARLQSEAKTQKIAELYLGFRPIAELDDSLLQRFKQVYAQRKNVQEKAAYFREQFSQALRRGVTDTQGQFIKAFLNKYEVRWESGAVELYLNGRKQTGEVKTRLGIDHNRLVINVPGATVHALYYGAIYELQETADKTLRLYDQGRNDPSRPLHIDEAMAKLDFTPRDPLDFVVPPVALDAHTLNLIRTPLYSLDEIFLVRGDSQPRPVCEVAMEKSYHLLVVTHSQGECGITYPGRDSQKTLRLQAGDMLIVPAGLKSYSLSTDQALTVLKAYESGPDEILAVREKRGMHFWEQPGFFGEQTTSSPQGG